MSDDPEAELANWRALLECPGWHQLVAYVRGQYGAAATLDRVKTLANKGEISEILAAHNAVDEVMSLPKIKILKLQTLGETRVEPLVPRRA